MTRKQPSKGDRALELFEKGIRGPAIAERLGVSLSRVHDMIHAARKRREREKAA